MASLIDSHCHLNFDYAPKATEDLLREGAENGVVAFVTVGTEVKTIPELQAISDAHANVYHTVGVHPHDSVDMAPGDLEALRKAAKHPKCRAIGEIGLDYHYDHSPREVQVRQLEAQLELAVETRLPVVIHSREAEDELLAALTRYAKRATGVVPGVIHCFTGTERFGRACLDLGFLISFSGILTFKNADDLRACARAFPLDRLLVETDSPFLAPIPYRGKKCEPSMVKLTAMKLGDLKGLSLEEAAQATTANARRVFAIR